MQNRRQAIKDAKFWAEEFLSRMKDFEESDPNYMDGKNQYRNWPNRNWAALKRASLDLTRCLAQMRNPTLQ